MKRQHIIIGVLALVFLLILTGGLTLAQGPGPEPEEASPQGTEGVAAVTNRTIPIQGRLTDANGNPISGTVSITFTLYTAAVTGTVVCQDNDDVDVANGLFNAYMDFCTASDINGQRLYLGIWVAGEPAEMTERQVIYPVPYAFSLVPGAIIGGSGAGDGSLYLYDGSGNRMINLDAGHGAIYLGGPGDDGDVVIYDTNGVTPTIQLGGSNGLVDVGGLGEDGDIYVRDATNSLTFDVNGATGDVSQALTGDGLVKAGAFVSCSGNATAIHSSFNNVGGTIGFVADPDAGQCTIDFGFDISDRYFVATGLMTDGARGVSCSRGGLPDDQLHCFRWDETGAAVSGDIMVLVY